ncbi:hypothetical protein MNV49_002568 [Pseudohyphozyma bogoriensis]|nr:hypothetical protein MNV49_002568 [Pseudohyphozyma bogoriensis]
MPPVNKPSNKPLKPYRRGETLGKASRAGKTPKPRPQATSGEKLNKPSTSKADAAQLDDDDDEEEEEDKVEAMEEPAKKKSGKKGKKFVESQDALLSLVASITGESESKKKEKLSKVKAPPKPEDVKRAQEKKEKHKKAQLDNAKALVKERTQKNKAAARPAPADDGGDAEPARKRVSFA